MELDLQGIGKTLYLRRVPVLDCILIKRLFLRITCTFVDDYSQVTPELLAF